MTFHQKPNYLLLLLVVLVCLLHTTDLARADEGNNSNNNNNNGNGNGNGNKDGRRGLFSSVNNWFSRLRGNRDGNNGNGNGNNNDDKKNEEKKEESTTARNPMMPGMPGFPPGFGMPGMPPGMGFSPMGPFGPGMMSAMPAMYGPMGMATQQFPSHVPMGAPGPRPMMPMAFSPMAPPAPMGNPFAFSGSHMMP